MNTTIFNKYLNKFSLFCLCLSGIIVICLNINSNIINETKDKIDEIDNTISEKNNISYWALNEHSKYINYIVQMNLMKAVNPIKYEELKNNSKYLLTNAIPTVHKSSGSTNNIYEEMKVNNDLIKLQLLLAKYINKINDKTEELKKQKNKLSLNYRAMTKVRDRWLLAILILNIIGNIFSLLMDSKKQP